MDYQKEKTERCHLAEKIANLEKEKDKISEKFKELYTSRNETEKSLVELTATVKALVQNMEKQFESNKEQFTAINSKLDEITNRINTLSSRG